MEPLGLGLIGYGGFGRFCLDVYAAMPEPCPGVAAPHVAGETGHRYSGGVVATYYHAWRRVAR
jgi:hypothetical protein